MWEENSYAILVLCPNLLHWKKIQTCADAGRIMTIHDVVKALHVETVCWKATWKLYSVSILSAHSKCEHHHKLFPEGWGIQFLNFFTHSFAADVTSMPAHWQEVLNEFCFRARAFYFHPLYDAAALRTRWDYMEALTCGNKCSLW